VNELLLFVDTFRIRPGRRAEFEQAAREIVDFVGAHEPRLLHYSIYLSESGLDGTGLQIHPDYDSVKRHRVVLGEQFGKIMELAEIVRIEIYGALSERRLAQIRNTAQAFGPVEVTAKGLAAGFHRTA
jgi:hypothetical protein